MLRDLMVNEIDAADATYTADVALATGMGVIADLTNKLAKLPTAETGTDILFVQKARIPTGCLAARTEFSDYEPQFNNYEKDDKVVLYDYSYRNIFATDQYDKAITDADIDKYVAWGTDGKAVIAATGTQSLYKFKGLYNDAGHILARFIKMEVPGTNA